MTLFRKPADQEGGLTTQGTILPRASVLVSFIEHAMGEVGRQTKKGDELGGSVLISSFLQAFVSEPAQVFPIS